MNVRFALIVAAGVEGLGGGGLKVLPAVVSRQRVILMAWRALSPGQSLDLCMPPRLVHHEADLAKPHGTTMGDD